MATATAVGSIDAFPNGRDNTMNQAVIYGTIAITASPATYATGGLAITWPQKDNRYSNNSGNPWWAEIVSISGSGYQYNYIRSTNKLQILTGAAAQSPLAELTNAASIPAAVSGDTIEFRAEFRRF